VFGQERTVLQVAVKKLPKVFYQQNVLDLSSTQNQ